MRRQAIEAEAARLVVLLEASQDAAERDAAYRWIAESPYHGVAFAAAAGAWNNGKRVRLRAEDDAAHGAAPEEQAVPDGSAFSRFSLSRRQVAGGLLATAAAGAGAIGLGMHFGLFGQRRSTLAGQRETAKLEDGSSIAMNGDTTLDVLLSDDRRQVRMLAGEAMFDVAKDPKRPFIVDLGDAQIRVLGTQFNVRRRKDVTELAVTEGVVSVYSLHTNPVEVHAGASALIRPGIATTLVEDPGLVRQRIAWTEGFLEFDERPLGEVVEEFNRYRKTPLVIGDPRISDTLITGRFGIEESAEFIDALQSSFDIRVEEGGSGSLILMRSD